ncbi:MAG: dihydrodipicolinate reductase C-terminal domain-containing protein [Planctomycetota bacterium]
MGRFADDWLADQPDLRVVARITSRSDWSRDLADAEIGLDFTRAGLGYGHAMRLLEAGLHVVVGTSGMDPAQDDALHQAAFEADLGCLVVPNFSVGACLMMRLAALAAPYLGDIAILEEHHPSKRDAPSGTALETHKRLAAVVGEQTEIPIHWRRLQGVLANQEVVFSGPGEVLRLRHEALDRRIYGPGIELALRQVRRLRGLQRGLDALLWPPSE